MVADPWISDEPRLGSVARDVFGRAWRRRRLVLALALLATGAYVALRGVKAPRHEAVVYFRLVEGELPDQAHGPRPPRDIQQHLWSVALSRNNLERIMREHRWSLAWLDRDPVSAVEAFREEIEIGVDRNYFITERGRGDPPRTANVTISLAGADAEETRALLHDIAAAVLQDQAAQRADRLDAARKALEVELAAVRARLRNLEKALAEARVGAASEDLEAGNEAWSRVATLQLETRSAVEQAVQIDRRLAAISFSGQAENERLGLNFELLDERLVTFSPRLSLARLGGQATLAFVLLFLLTAIAAGAFDDRVYVPADLAGSGLPLLGALPPFPGDDAGSFRVRASPVDPIYAPADLAGSGLPLLGALPRFPGDDAGSFRARIARP